MEQLPNEIISRIFRIISNDGNEALGATTIQTLRLVSHRSKSIASAFLVQRATVGLSTESFLRFEELCCHAVFRLSIRHVRINVSFYDVQLAEDRGRFFEHCVSGFYSMQQAFQSTIRKQSAVSKEKLRTLLRMPSEIRAMRNAEFDEASATLFQRTIIEFHQDYQSLTADQQELRRDDDHLRRLCECFAKLPALETIELDDGKLESRNIVNILEDVKIPPNDPRNLRFVLKRSMWKDSSESVYQAQQPFEMFGKLLSRLGSSKVRPSSISIDISVPKDLYNFQVTKEQARYIHDLVSKARYIGMSFSGWVRYFSHENDHYIGEMSALGSVTQALTTTSTLETLHVDLQGYPVFYQIPPVSAHALLPLHTIKWPALCDLRLRHIPMDMDDLVLLVGSHSDTLTILMMQSLFLRTGDWDEAIEHLKELKNLKAINISYPHGGRYGDQHNNIKKFPADDVRQYILGHSDENPLRISAVPAAW